MRSKQATLGRAALATLALLLSTQLVQAAGNVAGTWLLNVTTMAGKGDVTLILEQEGDQISGTYKGSLGEKPLKGTLKDDDTFELSFKADAMGSELDIVYTGKLEGSGITGKISFGSLGDGSFSGKRKEG